MNLIALGIVIMIFSQIVLSISYGDIKLVVFAISVVGFIISIIGICKNEK